VFAAEHCEIYEYQHLNQLSKNQNSCIFCNPESNRELITESAMFYSIYDKFPVSEGHSLIIPKNHITNYFKLSQHEYYASFLVLNRVQGIIQKKFKPNGFNIGLNIGETAGQTIDHIHIHLIPRYIGDCENPVGGIRNIFPLKANYIQSLDK